MGKKRISRRIPVDVKFPRGLEGVSIIHSIVCDHFNTPYDALLVKNRKKKIVKSRHISMYLAKKFTKNSLAFIANYFGGLKHCAVSNAIKKLHDLMDIYPEDKAEIDLLTNRVRERIIATASTS